MTEFL